MNRILNNHADWLDYNYSKVEGDECRKQAIAYAHKDENGNETMEEDNDEQSD